MNGGWQGSITREMSIIEDAGILRDGMAWRLR